MHRPRNMSKRQQTGARVPPPASTPGRSAEARTFSSDREFAPLVWRDRDFEPPAPSRVDLCVRTRTVSGTETKAKAQIGRPFRAEPKVRIHLPPAESQVRTCLSREFAFLRREAAVSAGVRAGAPRASLPT